MPMTRYVYRRVIKRGTINDRTNYIDEPPVEVLYEPLDVAQVHKDAAKLLLTLVLLGVACVLFSTFTSHYYEQRAQNYYGQEESS